MLCHKLRRLDSAEKLIRISSNITCDHFVSNDLALRIYDKAAALCKAICLDHDVETSCKLPCGICQHGILDLLDRLGRVMPCLVNIVGIA